MMKELASAVLTVDLPEHGLSAGDIGTIVLLHGNEGYEVEFVTLEGEPLAVVSLSADQLRPVEPAKSPTPALWRNRIDRSTSPFGSQFRRGARGQVAQDSPWAS